MSASRVFSRDEANALLPSVRPIVEALREMKSEAAAKLSHRTQLKGQSSQHPPGTTTSTLQQMIFTIECDLDFMHIQAHGYLRQLHLVGAQLKDVELGLVDFPGIYQGRDVLWCWKYGEEEIMHYHGLDDGFRGRRRIEP